MRFEYATPVDQTGNKDAKHFIRTQQDFFENFKEIQTE